MCYNWFMSNGKNYKNFSKLVCIIPALWNCIILAHIVRIPKLTCALSWQQKSTCNGDSKPCSIGSKPSIPSKQQILIVLGLTFKCQR